MLRNKTLLITLICHIYDKDQQKITQSSHTLVIHKKKNSTSTSTLILLDSNSEQLLEEELLVNMVNMSESIVDEATMTNPPL